jgi:purine-binding chemotaxis protein CheW
MALGRNLKKQSLIPDKEKETHDVPSAKQIKVEKKTLIKSKEKPTRERKSPSSFTGSLFHYITEQTLAHRSAVREKYQQEIQALAGKSVQLIVFDAGSEEFAIDISSVKEVISTPSIAKVPGMPSYFKGMIKVRKSTVLTMDLGEKLRISTADEFPYTLILRSAKQPLGLLLKELPRTYKVDGTRITGSLQALERTSRDEIFVKGLVSMNEKLVFYLDIEELVNSDNAVVVPDQLAKNEGA